MSSQSLRVGASGEAEKLASAIHVESFVKIFSSADISVAMRSVSAAPAHVCAPIPRTVPTPQPLTRAVCTRLPLTLDLLLPALLAACSQGALRRCPSTSSSSPAGALRDPRSPTRSRASRSTRWAWQPAGAATLRVDRRLCLLGRPRACLLSRLPCISRALAVPCAIQVSAAAEVAARTFVFAAVARAGGTGAVGSGQRGQWAGVRARQQGAAGAFRSQGSRQWARRTGGQRGACAGRRRRASRPSVCRSEECHVEALGRSMEVA